jgi:two-component system chemotaxis response regulator CheV
MGDTNGGFKSDILLEAGTNEVEILVFRLGDRHYGVNVAKVREVIRSVPVIDVPHKHESVVGFFEIRGHILTLLDLAAHLGIRAASTTTTRREPTPADTTAEGTAVSTDPASPNAPRATVVTTAGPAYEDRSIVVTEFNGQRLGFLIDGVERIHRVGWNRIQGVPRTSLGDRDDAGAPSVTNGVLMLDDQTLVLLVDFEAVADTILDENRLKNVGEVANETGISREDAVIVLAEDSAFMRANMRRALEISGYRNVHLAPDGLAAWAEIDRLGESIDVIVSDIEMPGMDGLALTRKIREDARFADIPVVLFSSLVSEDNAKKGRQVGANLQIPKPELPELVRMVDHLAGGLEYTPSHDVDVHGMSDGGWERTAAA